MPALFLLGFFAARPPVGVHWLRSPCKGADRAPARGVSVHVRLPIWASRVRTPRVSAHGGRGGSARLFFRPMCRAPGQSVPARRSQPAKAINGLALRRRGEMPPRSRRGGSLAMSR